MIAQVDEALCRLLRPCLPADTQIRLDPPKPTWQTEAQGRTIELFLFALRTAVGKAGTDTGGAGGGRDAGASTGVTRPSQKFTLSYLVTARAAGIREEHLLLDAALHALAAADRVSAKGQPARLEVSDTDPTNLWACLGMPARAGFVVTVTAGLDARRKTVAKV